MFKCRDSQNRCSMLLSSVVSKEGIFVVVFLALNLMQLEALEHLRLKLAILHTPAASCPVLLLLLLLVPTDCSRTICELRFQRLFFADFIHHRPTYLLLHVNELLLVRPVVSYVPPPRAAVEHIHLPATPCVSGQRVEIVSMNCVCLTRSIRRRGHVQNVRTVRDIRAKTGQAQLSAAEKGAAPIQTQMPSTFTLGGFQTT